MRDAVEVEPVDAARPEGQGGAGARVPAAGRLDRRGGTRAPPRLADGRARARSSTLLERALERAVTRAHLAPVHAARARPASGSRGSSASSSADRLRRRDRPARPVPLLRRGHHASSRSPRSSTRRRASSRTTPPAAARAEARAHPHGRTATASGSRRSSAGLFGWADPARPRTPSGRSGSSSSTSRANGRSSSSSTTSTGPSRRCST